ncbi:apolipoprotein N-acyltransferase [Pseudomaricurvus sp.]|uniref:apolipoprotein N-acyltransferase n=1 Tax=Pseudomaricurvus sp. TaxID=2004510 RepID=UPI003F6C70E7
MSTDVLESSEVKQSARVSAVVPGWLQSFLGAVLTGFLLALPYNYPSLYLLTWIAFVPLLWVAREASPAKAYALGLCSGLVMYLTAAFWIIDFIELYKGLDGVGLVAGAVVFWVCCAQLPACLMMLYRWICHNSGISGLYVFPVLCAVIYSYFPMLFTVQLGESQSQFLVALQATEFFGVASLDFVIALINVFFFMLLHKRYGTGSSGQIKSVSTPVQVSVCCLLAVWLGYGVWALDRWEQKVEGWPVKQVGIVQPNETPSESLPPPTPGYSRAYSPEMALSEKLIEKNVDLIVWPETRYKGYFSYPHVRNALETQVSASGIPLVFQDTEEIDQGLEREMHNTAVFLNAAGDLDARYRKIKRVPFGEYVPLLDYASSAKQWFYDNASGFFIDFLPGDGPVSFQVGEVSLVPLICYEVMFSQFTAQAVSEGTSGQVIVAMSNNGWFGDSLQPYQHMNSSVLRSVENRVPMVHVTNNGPSGLVLPSGRLVAQTAYHTKMAAVLNVPYSQESSGSFFSHHPFVFSNTLFAVLFGLFLIALWRRFG